MRRAWMRELAGWAGALCVALLTAAQVASSARGELLFRDGDSLIVALIARSVLSGQPSDWALSSVLFLPETAVFTGLDAALGLGVNGLLAVNAVLNIVGLYGALRLVAGRRRADTAPVAWALVGLVAFSLLAMTETSSSRDALELASLQLTTTYYAATVVAVTLSVGLVRRVIDRATGGVGLLIGLGATATVSTLSNPLYAAWATVPLSLLLGALALRSPRRLRMTTTLAVLLGATALGFVARIPFAAWIANTGAGYIQPGQWMQSSEYYAGLLADRVATPTGVLGGLMVLALLALAVFRTVQAEEPGARFVAAAAWVMPVLVAIGAVALGTHAARYLQPLAFAPVLALVAMPRAWRMPRRFRALVAAAAAVLLVAAGAVGIPRLAAATGSADPDLSCVTGWVNASGRTGAGQFWTVRLPKLHLDDPAQLVQVDHELNGYAWLVNRRDFDVGEVSFLVEDAQTVAWSLPSPAIPDEVIDCGRYRVLDFGETTLPIGPQRS
jgi:hypothetical protein